MRNIKAISVAVFIFTSFLSNRTFAVQPQNYQDESYEVDEAPSYQPQTVLPSKRQNSYRPRPLSLLRPHNIMIGSSVFITESVGTNFTFDYNFLDWISAGFGFGYLAGNSWKNSSFTFNQILFPLFVNFYLLQSENMEHRFYVFPTMQPFIEFDDKFVNCTSFNLFCYVRRAQTWGGVYLGGGAGYEYRNYGGFLFRFSGVLLVSVPNPAINQEPVDENFRIHLPVLPVVQFGFGYSF